MRIRFFILIIFVFLSVSQTAEALVFEDNFEGSGSLAMDGWTQKIGAWAVYGDSTNHYLQNTGSPYGTIWKDDTFGVYQGIKVDAYFDLSSGWDDQDAHLRVRTNENLHGIQSFWDTGYLADISPTRIVITDCFQWNNPTLFQHDFSGVSPISATGWHELEFRVSGKGVDTHFDLLINGQKYIDSDYSNLTPELDSGYVGLGRRIQYDNAQGYSSFSQAVPEPATLLLFGSGLFGMFIRKRRV